MGPCIARYAAPFELSPMMRGPGHGGAPLLDRLGGSATAGPPLNLNAVEGDRLPT